MDVNVPPSGHKHTYLCQATPRWLYNKVAYNRIKAGAFIYETSHFTTFVFTSFHCPDYSKWMLPLHPARVSVWLAPSSEPWCITSNIFDIFITTQIPSSKTDYWFRKAPISFEILRYITPSLTGWAQTKPDPWLGTANFTVFVSDYGKTVYRTILIIISFLWNKLQKLLFFSTKQVHHFSLGIRAWMGNNLKLGHGLSNTIREHVCAKYAQGGVIVYFDLYRGIPGTYLLIFLTARALSQYKDRLSQLWGFPF